MLYGVEYFVYDLISLLIWKIQSRNLEKPTFIRIGVLYLSNKMAENFTSIPVIDFSLYTTLETKPQFLCELRNAVVKVGFFYLKNHGISDQVQCQLLSQTKEFFDLRTEEKQKVAIDNSKHFLGYAGYTARSTGSIDHRETFTVSFPRRCIAKVHEG
jgi:isopenicillin N synthase-like dioxygenase